MLAKSVLVKFLNPPSYHFLSQYKILDTLRILVAELPHVSELTLVLLSPTKQDIIGKYSIIIVWSDNHLHIDDSYQFGYISFILFIYSFDSWLANYSKRKNVLFGKTFFLFKSLDFLIFQMEMVIEMPFLNTAIVFFQTFIVSGWEKTCFAQYQGLSICQVTFWHSHFIFMENADNIKYYSCQSLKTPLCDIFLFFLHL